MCRGCLMRLFGKGVRIMKELLVIASALIIVGCCNAGENMIRAEDMNNDEGVRVKTLTILWQHLVDESGWTCERCELTGEEVLKAYHSLQQSLAPLGIEVTLEEKTLDPATFAQDVSQSNRIWIGGRSLEEWLDAEVGKSLCCGPCGDEECRTMIVEGHTYETIPADLIVKAGLLAASQLFSGEPSGPCCEPTISTEVPSGSCCPPSENCSVECE